MKDNNIRFLHDCLLIDDKILVIGDLHFGYGEQFHGKAVFPGQQLKDVIEKLSGVFDFLKKEKIKIKKIVLLGDVKHDFRKITDIEWRETLEFLDFLKENTDDKCKVIVIKGNHDTKLAPILRKRGILLKDFYKVSVGGKKICFFHGDKLFKQCLDSQTGILIFGHLHPAITLEDKYKREKYKCFLRGKWKRKEVYILPSFSSVSYGYDFRNNYFVGNKFFIEDFRNFDVIIYNNKEKKGYNFGKLKKLI